MIDALKLEELQYVTILAQQYSTVAQYYEDEDGNVNYYTDPQRTLEVFLTRIDKNSIRAPFTKEKYLANEDIINTVEGFEMDVDKFWYALLFVYDYVETMCIGKVGMSMPSVYDQLSHLWNYLQQHPKATITVKHADANKKETLEIGDNEFLSECLQVAINGLITNVEDYLKNSDPNDSQADDYRSKFFCNRVKMGAKSMETADYIKALDAKMFRTLFEQLNLSDNQANYTHQNTERVSYDKMLLISRIVYMYRHTTTESYLYSSNAITKAYAKYKNHNLTSHLSAIY